MPILPTSDNALQLDKQAQPQVQTSGAVGGAIADIGAITGMISNYHKAKENAATVQVQKMTAAMSAGFPVDPKAMTKAFKNAGIPLMTGPDATALVDHGSKASKGAAARGDGPQAASGGQPTLNRRDGGAPFVSGTDPKTGQPQDPHAAAFNLASIADVKARQKKETELSVDHIVRQAVTNHRLQGANDQQTLELTHNLLDLKAKSINGDMQAYGTLLRMGEIKGVDIPAQVFAGMNEKQKSAYIATQAGYESPQETTARVSQSAQAQLTQGRFDNLEDATAYVNAVNSGTPIPPELTAKEHAHTLSDLATSVGVLDTFAKMGYNGNSLIDIAQKYPVMGINSLPKGMQSIYLTEARNQTTEAGAAATNAQTGRTQTEGYNKKDPDGKPVHVQGTLEDEMSSQSIRAAEVKAQMMKVEAYMKGAENKEFLSGYAQTMLSARAKPGSIPQSVLDDWNKALVERAGGTITEEQVSTWFGLSSKKVQGVSFPTPGAETSDNQVGAP